MNLVELLKERGGEIVGEATTALSRAQLKHYEESGVTQSRQRLAKLYALTLKCVEERNLLPIVQYSHEIARERRRDGFDLQEVQTAFNVLEEVIWKRITAEIAPPDYPEAFGLASTVLGAGKQALAVEYVRLASKKGEVESLDLRALFKNA
jgi:hypothetical protein